MHYTMTMPQKCTSPWTEPYQAASPMPQEQSVAQAAFEQECQRPTHDALSDIYNRETPPS
jgi:hypothetical protein